MEFIQFDIDDENIKKNILEKCDNTLKKQAELRFISYDITINNGIIIKINNLLKGFVIYNLIPNKKMTLNLICIKYNYDHGKKLLEFAEVKAKEHNVQYIELFSYGDKKLLKWYENLGFIDKMLLPYKNIQNKIFLMKKFLI